METMTIPDFTVYRRVYTITDTVLVKKKPVPIVSTLTQRKNEFQTWVWENDQLTGVRAGFTLRVGSEARHILYSAVNTMQQGTHQALLAAGWTGDGFSYEAPLSVWKDALKEIR